MTQMSNPWLDITEGESVGAREENVSRCEDAFSMADGPLVEHPDVILKEPQSVKSVS